MTLDAILVDSPVFYRDNKSDKIDGTDEDPFLTNKYPIYKFPKITTLPVYEKCESTSLSDDEIKAYQQEIENICKHFNLESLQPSLYENSLVYDFIDCGSSTLRISHGHSYIITAFNSETVTLFHANWGNNNGVYYKKISYSEYNKCYQFIIKYINPCL